MKEVLKLRILFLFIAVSHGWIAFRAFYTLPNQQYAWLLMGACSVGGAIGFLASFHKSAETSWESTPRKIGM